MKHCWDRCEEDNWLYEGEDLARAQRVARNGGVQMAGGQEGKLQWRGEEQRD